MPCWPWAPEVRQLWVIPHIQSSPPAPWCFQLDTSSSSRWCHTGCRCHDWTCLTSPWFSSPSRWSVHVLCQSATEQKIFVGYNLTLQRIKRQLILFFMKSKVWKLSSRMLTQISMQTDLSWKMNEMFWCNSAGRVPSLDSSESWLRHCHHQHSSPPCQTSSSHPNLWSV